MRRPVRLLVAVLATILATPLAASALPRACRQCHTGCGDAISACLAAEVRSCPASPRRKAHRCASKARRHCKQATTAGCLHACKQTGKVACGTTSPTTCAAFTSSCAAAPLTPSLSSPPATDPRIFDFRVYTASPGPAGCCVIDECAGITQANPNAGSVSADFHEVEYGPNPQQGAVSTRTGVACQVQIPTDVYARSDIYRVTFMLDQNQPVGQESWTAPYVLAPGDLALSIDSANVPYRSEFGNSFTPSTWRLVGQTLSVDKACAEQQLVTGHATASFVKNDGTACTVTIYAQGTRVVDQ